MSWFRRRKRYTVAIRGCYSGSVTPPLDFIRFKTEAQAQAWIDRMPSPSGMTDWVILPVPR